MCILIVSDLIYFCNDGFPLLKKYNNIFSLELYDELNKFDKQFLQINHEALQYYSNKWIDDPLCSWSRAWEYPYTFERLRSVINSEHNYNVLDAGSGLTFFPFYIANMFKNSTIRCYDNDEKIINSYSKMITKYSNISYSVEDLLNMNTIEQFDMIYSISVLEHLINYKKVIQNLYNILKKGGYLILTFDISLNKANGITLANAKSMVKFAIELFSSRDDYTNQFNNLDFDKILTTKYISLNMPELYFKTFKKSLIPLHQYSIIKNIFYISPPNLTCFCMILKK